MAIAPILRLNAISKSFGSTRALDRVSLDLMPGEVHALIGENGAGKSTLLGILTGVVAPDGGTIEIDGRITSIDGPARAQALGIGTVFQELSLAGSLSVAENIFAGRLPATLGLVRRRTLRAKAREVLAPFGIEIPVDRAVDALPAGHRQIVEIAKALSLKSRILLLDEPTSALTSDEVEALMRIVEHLKQQGIAVVYVSHKLAEVFRIADRITVLRDGSVVSTRPAAETTADRVVHEMVGMPLQPRARQESDIGAVILETRGLSRKGEFTDIDLTLRAGEVVGLAGLVGAGRRELAQALAGLSEPHSGMILVNGGPVVLRSLRDAIVRRIAYVPDDRKTDGLFLTLSVLENATVTTLPRISRLGMIDKRASRATADAAIQRFHIKMGGLSAPAGSLSGGNQQKLMLAKWLAIGPAIVIVNEPTKGVDIQAKLEIHRELRRLSAAGCAILVVSSDLPELLAVCDRIVVMREGRVVGAVAADATEEQVMRMAAGTPHSSDLGAAA